MTRVTISGNANGTGNVNFAAPNTNSAITVTLPTSNVDMDNLGASTTAGDVGTYAFLSGTVSITPGGTASGANLVYTNATAYGTGASPTISGTWQGMGLAYGGLFGVSSYASTLFVRIS